MIAATTAATMMELVNAWPNQPMESMAGIFSASNGI